MKRTILLIVEGIFILMVTAGCSTFVVNAPGQKDSFAGTDKNGGDTNTDADMSVDTGSDGDTAVIFDPGVDPGPGADSTEIFDLGVDPDPGTDSTVTSDPGVDTGNDGDTAVIFDPGVGIDSGIDNGGTTEVCQSCVTDNCPSEIRACQPDPGCTEISMCVRNCPPNETSCNNDCMKENLDSAGDFMLLQLCVDRYCTIPCKNSKPDPCSECITNKCYNPLAACYKNLECVKLLLCIEDCKDDQDCLKQCVQQYQSAVNGIQDIQNCYQDNCGSACGL